MNMNQRIREHIKSNKMTYTVVSELAGIDMKKFSRMMTGRQKINTGDYEKICKALKVSPMFFYSEKFLESQNTA